MLTEIRLNTLGNFGYWNFNWILFRGNRLSVVVLLQEMRELSSLLYLSHPSSLVCSYLFFLWQLAAIPTARSFRLAWSELELKSSAEILQKSLRRFFLISASEGAYFGNWRAISAASLVVFLSISNLGYCWDSGKYILLGWLRYTLHEFFYIMVFI